VSSIQDGDPVNPGLISDKVRELSVLPRGRIGSEAQLVCCLLGNNACFPELDRPRDEADHSLLSSAE